MWESYRRSDSPAIDGECRWDAPVESAASAPSSGDGGAGSPPASEPATPAPTPTPAPSSASPASPSPQRDGSPSDEDDDTDVDVDRDEDHADLPFKDHPRFKAINRRARKLAKSLTKANRAVAQHADEAAAYRRIQAQFASDPELAEAIVSGDYSKLAARSSRRAESPSHSRQAPASRAEETEDLFDPAAFPFDTSTAEGRYLLERLKSAHESAALARKLQARLDAIEGRDVEQRERAVQGSWKGAADAAASQIKDEGVRAIFLDAVYGAFSEAKARKLSLKPQQVIGHYLGLLKVSATETAKAQSASAQAQVAKAQSQPRPFPATTPAPPSALRKRETVEDVNRRLRGMR